MGEELKPCPFCGGEPEEFSVTDEKTQPLVGGHPLTVRTGNAFFGVRCPRCDVAQTNPFIERDYAVEAWNKRPDPAATMKEVREVLSDLEEYFDNRSDVVDGDDRQPEPNAEMRHLTAVQSLLAKLGGE